MTSYVINDRRELIIALNEAALIEQCLMLQYLYAAFSLKQSESEGITSEQSELVRSWKADLLRVARDEMGHLGTVLNMLNAVGGVADLQHPNFPLPSPRWFPFPFELTPFNVDSVRRFVRFEEPQPVRFLAFGLPRQPVYDYVGELYRAIRQGFSTLAAANPRLFIGDPKVQDASSWATLRFAPRPIRNAPEAEAAIDAVVEQGEGTPSGSDPLAHYATFTRISAELDAALKDDPNFVPARPCVVNPALRKHPESGENVTLIDERTFEGRCCAVFSEFYAVLLQCLNAHYAAVNLGDPVRAEVQRITRSLMSGILRPLGEVITTLKHSGSTANATCGPTFEAIGPVSLPPVAPECWIVVGERVEQAVQSLAEVAGDALAPPRLRTLLASAQGLRDAVAALEGSHGA